MLLNERSRSRLQSLLNTFHSPDFLQRFLSPYSSVMSSTDTASTILAGPPLTSAEQWQQQDGTLNHLYLLSQVCGVDAASQTGIFAAIAEEADAAAAAGLPASTTTATAPTSSIVGTGTSKGGGAKAKRKNAVNTRVNLAALNKAHILALLCLLSYHPHQQHQQQDRLRTVQDQQGEQLSAGQSGAAAFADYMIKFDAGEHHSFLG